MPDRNILIEVDRPGAVVNVRKSSSKDGGIGWEITANSDCTKEEADKAMETALDLVARVKAGLGGQG